MAAIWKGSLTFGLVNIPVELKTAVRADHISFRLLHKDDLSPVKYERVCQADGESVPWNEIVKGYEYDKGKFVVLTDEDFKAAALEQSKTIDILDFVREDEIDPRYFETPYYLVPAKGGEKPYALLREAIRQTGSVGIGKIIIRQTQHLAGVKVVGEALVLEIMRFANELVDASEFNFPNREAVRPQELQMAEQLVAKKSEVGEGEARRVVVDGTEVLICNVGGEIYAVEDICTHDGGAHDQGELDGARIMCPRHGATFDVRSGEALTLPAIMPLPTYSVRIDGDDIYVTL